MGRGMFKVTALMVYSMIRIELFVSGISCGNSRLDVNTLILCQLVVNCILYIFLFDLVKL